MIIASYKCSICGTVHPDISGVKADERQCRVDYWLEQNFTDPKGQCRMCRREGTIYEGEPCYYCKRHWEMPKELGEVCDGWEPRNFEWR